MYAQTRMAWRTVRLGHFVVGFSLRVLFWRSSRELSLPDFCNGAVNGGFALILVAVSRNVYRCLRKDVVVCFFSGTIVFLQLDGSVCGAHRRASELTIRRYDLQITAGRHGNIKYVNI